jgi:hypothetical protein
MNTCPSQTAALTHIGVAHTLLRGKGCAGTQVKLMFARTDKEHRHKHIAINKRTRTLSPHRARSIKVRMRRGSSNRTHGWINIQGADAILKLYLY